MKKKLIIVLLLILIIPINANAKTLGQLKKEYSALEAKLNAKNNQIKQNQQATSNAKARIQSIYGEIAQAENDIKKINNDIVKLNDDIKIKNEEISDLMRFIQVSEGESTYLEYIFKAKSITDFIYRLSVTEQLTTYNNKLIDDMNNMIKKNNENIESLHKKEDSLRDLQVELKEKLVVLADEKKSLDKEEEGIEKDIKYSKSIINYYIKAGCKESQDISNCANSQLPPDTQFLRPLKSGLMYSTWKSDILSGGGCRRHAGVDIAAPGGTPIYPIANGTVVYAGNAGDGYGNKVIVHHTVNGRNYSSLYGHMSSIAVWKGRVDRNQVIGYVGSTGNSYGNHLHLNVCLGLKSCVSWGDTVDPGSYINFPGNKRSFSDRTSRYSGYYSNPCRY